MGKTTEINPILVCEKSILSYKSGLENKELIHFSLYFQTNQVIMKGSLYFAFIVLHFSRDLKNIPLSSN